MTNTQNPIEQQNKTAVTKEDENGLMTTLEHGLGEIATQPPAVLVVDVVKLDVPYIVMLSMAVFGIGLITFKGQPAALYWEV